LLIGSHLGTYAIVTVGVVRNAEALAGQALRKGAHFSEMSGGEVNSTELVATLINQEATFAEGIAKVQEVIVGSCSMLLLTDHGIYAARDRLGRTPVVLGSKPGAYAASLETCAFPNLGYELEGYLGPGEVVLITPEGVQQIRPPGDEMKICAFLWVYYGYPASSYEGINVEATRYRCGAALARRDDVQIDLVAGIPDSGTGHAVGYANESAKPFQRPFVKYTPTWPRSFMPQDQRVRDLVAKMKLIPIREIIENRRLLFCDDSIVRGTQLRDTIRRLFENGAKEVHMRVACPPLVYSCPFLNFSRSRSELDLAARKAIQHMKDIVRKAIGLTSLKYQTLDDLIGAIGLPKCKLCTYCWDGADPPEDP